MNENNSDTDKFKANDGTTLDLVVNDVETLPSGLARLRSGVIAITQAFCPNGHNMVSAESNARFNGYPGISIYVKGKYKEGVVIVSPIHGDDTRFGMSDFEPGHITELCCPECKVPLPPINKCGCMDDSYLVGLFLDEKLEEGNQVAVCNAWGCLRSRITDRFQVISKLE